MYIVNAKVPMFSKLPPRILIIIWTLRKGEVLYPKVSNTIPEVIP